MSTSFSSRLLSKLKSKVYRAAYVAENVRMGIALQIRAMREQRSGMSQAELGKLLGKPQSVVSRLENPDYGKATVQTLQEVADAFDVALLIKFVTYPEFLRQTEDVSPEGLRVESYSDEQMAEASLAEAINQGNSGGHLKSGG